MSEAYPDMLVGTGTVGKSDTDFPEAQNSRNCKLQLRLLRLFLYPLLHRLKCQFHQGYSPVRNKWAICICHFQLFLIDCIQSCLRGFCGLLEGIGCRNIFNFHFICCNGQSIKYFSASRINGIRGRMHGLR